MTPSVEAPLRKRAAAGADQAAAEAFPVARESLPSSELRSGDYVLRFADSPEALDQVLRLRFRVFNLELGEGLDESLGTGRDEDSFDACFHHMVVHRRSTGEAVGTYRMQTAAMAAGHRGFYSEGEFDLTGFPADFLDRAVEIGRACVAREHRTGRVLHLLWRGLAEYLMWNRKRYLFGCCSLTSQDRALGGEAYAHLRAQGLQHSSVHALPLPGLECEAPGGGPGSPAPPEIHIPALFQSYLNLGAKICGPPAIDRLFKTLDFLVVLDVEALDERAYRSFFR